MVERRAAAVWRLAASPKGRGGCFTVHPSIGFVLRLLRG